MCVGRNYADHAKELGNQIPSEPVLFLKPNSAISGELRSNPAENLQFEGEISFVVREGALAGVGFGLDLTKRDLQRLLKEKGLPWERAKAFDGSAIFSEFVRLEGGVSDLRMTLDVNGETVQRGGCEDMIFQPQALLDEIAATFTLADGDIVMTGTPAGVDSFAAGDRLMGRVFDGTKLLSEGCWTAI